MSSIPIVPDSVKRFRQRPELRAHRDAVRAEVHARFEPLLRQAGLLAGFALLWKRWRETWRELAKITPSSQAL